MSDFNPQTDLPHVIDPDDNPVESTARMRDAAIQRRRKWILRAAVLVAGITILATGTSPFRTLVAIALMYGVFTTGLAVLGAFARPVPEPPPPGELRRVKLHYRCSSCGAEMRMMLSPEQVPNPPRHCADEMELLTSAEDI